MCAHGKKCPTYCPTLYNYKDVDWLRRTISKSKPYQHSHFIDTICFNTGFVIIFFCNSWLTSSYFDYNLQTHALIEVLSYCRCMSMRSTRKRSMKESVSSSTGGRSMVMMATMATVRVGIAVQINVTIYTPYIILIEQWQGYVYISICVYMTSSTHL